MTRLSSIVRRAALALPLVALPAALSAQIFKVSKKSDEPAFWGSVGIGLLRMQGAINDGTTQSQWQFSGSDPQYRASLEYALKGGSAVGVVGTYAHVPFTWVPLGGVSTGGASGNPLGVCPSGCDATMNVTSVWGTFHSGDGVGLRYLFEGGLGYTYYGSFKREDTGESLGTKTDNDFSFYIGTGVGYGVSSRLGINLSEDLGISRHQGEGLTNNERTTLQSYTTRLTLRAGFGNRRPGI